MARLDYKGLLSFIEPKIIDFHERRIQKLSNLKLIDVLKRKNPYLFKAKNLNTAAELVKSILDAHLSSQEEAIFGGFLEELAIHICKQVYGGDKSSTVGIDLEFNKDGIRYIVSIKSGPNWGNAGQIRKMIDNFKRAKITLRTNAPHTNVVAVNGCCYGKQRNPDRGDYFKYCGQKFWEFISGDDNLFVEIIEPMGHKAKEHNEAFEREYAKVINKFTQDFGEQFLKETGEIDWEGLVRFNSKK